MQWNQTMCRSEPFGKQYVRHTGQHMTLCDMCPIAHEFSVEPIYHARLHHTRFPTITVCDNVLSQTVQESLRTHTSFADCLWFVVYHRQLRQEWRVVFVWDPTCFLKNLRLGLYFTLGTVYFELSCAITWYHKRFRRPYAHVVALQIVCDLYVSPTVPLRFTYAFRCGSHTII